MRRYSTAERIVYEFVHNVTEVHRRAIETTLGITPEQFDEAMPRAKDLAVERPDALRLTPVYRPVGENGRFTSEGWWTCRPTERLAAIAEYEALLQDLGRKERVLRVQRGTKLEDAARFAVRAVKMSIQEFLDEHQALLDIRESVDYVIEAIDDATPRLFVLRRDRAAA
jgi:hypothetical protein